MTSTATLKIFSKEKIENAELKIYDLLGKEVKSISGINSDKIKVERKNISSGTYFYCLRNFNKIIAHGKIMIQ